MFFYINWNTFFFFFCMQHENRRKHRPWRRKGGEICEFTDFTPFVVVVVVGGVVLVAFQRISSRPFEISQHRGFSYTFFACLKWSPWGVLEFSLIICLLSFFLSKIIDELIWIIFWILVDTVELNIFFVKIIFSLKISSFGW